MTEHEKRIREALEAGPTEGVWHWHGDPVKGDPTGRVRFEVVTSGKTITRIYYSSYEGGPTNAGQDAAHIAACNPAALRALLADLDEARAALTAAKAGGWLPIETAPRGSGIDGPDSVSHPDYVEPPKLLLWTEEGPLVGYYDWYYHPGYGRGAEDGESAWRDHSGARTYGATAWQPLPNPPKGEV